jgi:hypothetical protein
VSARLRQGGLAIPCRDRSGVTKEKHAHRPGTSAAGAPSLAMALVFGAVTARSEDGAGPARGHPPCRTSPGHEQGDEVEDEPFEVDAETAAVVGDPRPECSCRSAQW